MKKNRIPEPLKRFGMRKKKERESFCCVRNILNEEGGKGLQILEIRDEELPKASELLWKSFYFSERKNTSVEGMELFRDLTDPISLAMNRVDGSLRLFGAWKKEVLVGIFAWKIPSHLLLLYVHPEYKHQGIGREMLNFVLQNIKGNCITVNSSDEAVSFYQKFGFETYGPRTEEKGMIYTPMVLQR